MNIVETDYQPRDFDVHVEPSFRGGDSGVRFVAPHNQIFIDANNRPSQAPHPTLPDGSKMLVIDPEVAHYERPSICINGSDLAEAANTCDLVRIEEGFTLDSFVAIRKVSADVRTIEFHEGDGVP